MMSGGRVGRKRKGEAKKQVRRLPSSKAGLDAEYEKRSKRAARRR